MRVKTRWKLKMGLRLSHLGEIVGEVLAVYRCALRLRSASALVRGVLIIVEKGYGLYRKDPRSVKCLCDTEGRHFRRHRTNPWIIRYELYAIRLTQPHSPPFLVVGSIVVLLTHSS